MGAYFTTRRNGKGGKHVFAVILASVLMWASVARAEIVNSVVVDGTALGQPVSTNATASVDVVDQISTMSLSKVGVFDDANGNGKAESGETITYTFTAKNTGNVTLTNVTLSDVKVTPGSFAVDVDAAPAGDSTDTAASGWAVLAPGDSLVSTSTYTLTVADLDASEVVNTATVSATTIPGTTFSQNATSTIPLVTDASIALEKSGALALGNGQADVGDIITYTFKVTNTGPTTLKNIKITDPKLLLADLQKVQSLDQLIQVASVPADPITTASIDAEPVSPAEREPADWHAAVPQEPAALDAVRRLVRLDSSEAPFKAGDRIGVYFAMTNTGNVPLTTIDVVQPGSEAYGSRIDYLAPNMRDAANILFSYVLTDEDIETGQVQFVSGVTAHTRGRVLMQTLREPLSLLDVDYPNEIETAALTPASIAFLPPGGVTFLTAPYAITQADIDAGQVLNTAEVSATTAMKTVLLASASATVPVPQAPKLALAKISSLNLGPDGVAGVGDVVTFTFALANIGNTTLNNVTITDTLPGLSFNFTPFDNFAPGTTQNFTGTYALNQTDIDAAKVENQAFASGIPTNGGSPIPNVLSDDPITPALNDKTITKIPQAPKIALVKKVQTVADTNGNGMTDVGDTVTYAFTVKNVGNTKLFDIYVKDRDAAVVETPDPAAPTGVSLAAGAEDLTTFKATYILKQEDADRGYYDNTADVHGFAADGTEAIDESDPAVYLQNAPTRVTITQAPKIAVLKPQPTFVDTNGNGFTDVGDVLNYSLQVINTGNVSLSNVVITDPQANNFTFTIPTLAPGLVNAQTVAVPYTVTKADVIAGRVSNTAFATTSFGGGLISDKSDASNTTQDNATVTPIVPFPAIAIVKPQPDIVDTPTVEDPTGNGVMDEGDKFIYKFAVTNTGNVPLSNIVITDLKGVLTGTRTTPLDPGDTDSTTFKLEYTLVTADIIAGSVTNTADIVGLSPTLVPARDTSDDTSITQNDPTVTPLANTIAPAIAMTKASTIADTNNNGITDAGDTINFTFNVTNTGNVRLNNIVVTDPKMVTEGKCVPNCGVIPTLAKGATSSALKVTHVITQADVDNSGYENQASVTASNGARIVTDLSDGSSLTGNNPTKVTIERIAKLALLKPEPLMDVNPLLSDIKDVNENQITDAEDILTFRFKVYNVGNVALYNVDVADPKANMLPHAPIPVLLPGQSDTVTFKATHEVTDVDAVSKKFVNQATASARDNKGTLVEDLSDETSLTGNAPTITPVVRVDPAVSKTANRAAIRRGERVEYTITATALGKGPYDLADLLPPGMTYIAGSSSVDDAAREPAISGKTLTWTSITPKKTTKPGETRKITIKLSMQASASTTMQTGETINRARLYLNATGDFLGEGQARVTIKEEAIFDCGEIIGRVFDDLNNNGYMDDGEPGLPGVRVVTVKGLLVTTDKFGRFHVTCADVPNAQIGSNFLMKLDPRTLPAGYVLTTENPRDVRLTRGKITKLNFGASKQRDVALDLTRDAFGPGLDLKPKFAAGLDRLVNLMSQGRGALTITYRCGIYAPVADDRVQAVAETLQAKWKEEGGNKPLKITTRVECGK
jgi:uncharacterized repeat protein (TIGR01451 family)